jgi:hypothetical protein
MPYGYRINGGIGSKYVSQGANTYPADNGISQSYGGGVANSSIFGAYALK